MTYEFNCTGTARKDLVKALSTITGEAAKYQGAPTFAYQVGFITVDKNGDLHMDDHADPDMVQALIDQLHKDGILCNLYYADTDEDYDKYYALGIDNLLTNRMDLAAAWRRK